MPSGSRVGWKRAPTSVFRCRCASFYFARFRRAVSAKYATCRTSDRSWAMRVDLLSIGCIFCVGVGAPAMSADRTLSVTIYADDLALVQDRRDIEVKGGRQRIEFEDVSAQIRPETASLTAGDIGIVEQNFDFDLLTPAKLMEKAVGHEVTIVRVNPATGAETREQAQVLATNGGVVLKIGQRIEVLRDDGLPVRVIFDKVRENLRARPKLAWS